MRKIIWFITLTMGCVDADPEPEPRVYDCTILYRCHGDVDIRARVALPCAATDNGAIDRAMALGIIAAVERCGEDHWQYVRPLCAPYEPVTACEINN